MAVLNQDKDGCSRVHECKNNETEQSRYVCTDKSKLFIKYKADIANRVDGVDGEVVYFGQLLFESNHHKFSCEFRCERLAFI